MTVVFEREKARVNGNTYTLQMEATSPEFVAKWYLTIDGRPKMDMQGLSEKPNLKDYVSERTGVPVSDISVERWVCDAQP